MEKPDTVRLAGTDDMANLYWHLMGDLRADNPVGIAESPKAVFETVKECCTMNNAIAGIIDGPNGMILGSIGIKAMVPWFSDATILTQVWLFVSPQARRGTRLGDDLFQFAQWHRQDMSERIGYDIVFENTIWSMTRLPAKIRLWGRYGTQVGAIFWERGVDHGQDEQQEPDEPADRSGGGGRVQQPSDAGSEPGVTATQPLQRPTRRPA